VDLIDGKLGRDDEMTETRLTALLIATLVARAAEEVMLDAVPINSGGSDHSDLALVTRLLFDIGMVLASAADGRVTETAAMRNGIIQGVYLIVAARAPELDCGSMSELDNAGVDQAFFAGTSIQSNFIWSIGYGDLDSLFHAIRG
jgi:hypothetical protein